MSLAFIYPVLSRKALQICLIRSNLFFFSFLYICSTNSYSQSLSAEQIYKNVSGAVVVIYAYDNDDKLTMQGSGVVFNDKGYVVTNYHILSGNKRIEIIHGKEIIPYVDIIGIDVEKDILILKIEEQRFSSIKIGNSKSLNIGQRVYAIGSPMGLENSISEGIVSGLRSYDELKRNFIQISASISSGSSGGAVVNDKGELVGISTLTIKEGQNLNFAIPIDDILNVEIGSYSKNDMYKDFELFKFGNDALEKGNYQKSIKYFSLYIVKYPNDPSAYYNCGIARTKSEDFIGAIQDFNKAIDLNPYFTDAYNNRGFAKSESGNNNGAFQDYNKAIELDPNCTRAYVNRGVIKHNLEDYQGAFQDYNKAIEQNPYYADAYYNRGTAKASLKDYQGALKDFNKSIELIPNMRVAYYNRGLTKYNLKDYHGAIQDYDKAIKLNSNYADVYMNRGVAKSNLNDDRGAIKDYSKAIEINPNHAMAYFNRGIAKYLLVDKEGACQDWNKAGKLGWMDAYEIIKKLCK